MENFLIVHHKKTNQKKSYIYKGSPIQKDKSKKSFPQSLLKNCGKNVENSEKKWKTFFIINVEKI